MDAFLNLTVTPFFIGLIIMAAGHVVYEQTVGWEDRRGMAALSGAFQIWLLGFIAVAIYGGL